MPGFTPPRHVPPLPGQTKDEALRVMSEGSWAALAEALAGPKEYCGKGGAGPRSAAQPRTWAAVYASGRGHRAFAAGSRRGTSAGAVQEMVRSGRGYTCSACSLWIMSKSPSRLILVGWYTLAHRRAP